MKEVDIAAVRAELEGFVEDVFKSLPRAEQRAKGSLYLRGLMLDGKRKSMQPMAERLGVDFLQLQKFVSSSPWKIEPVRRVIATRATQTIVNIWGVKQIRMSPKTRSPLSLEESLRMQKQALTNGSFVVQIMLRT